MPAITGCGLFITHLSMSGRGRGRGRAPPSGARLLLQRSAQEAGLDAGNLRSLQDITKPQLYPDFEWHSSGAQGHDPVHPPAASQQSQSSSASKRATSQIYLINKSREMNQRYQDSPLFVRPSQEVDVVRYNKRPRPLEPDVHLAEYIGKAGDPRYLPEELLPDKAPPFVAAISGRIGEHAEDGTPKRALTLEELAAEEIQQRKKPSSGATGEEEEEQGELSDTQEPEEDEEEVADYTANYYASDDESGGEGEEEAVF